MFAIWSWLVSSVSPSLKRLMAQLNRHHNEIDSFYGDFFKSLWLIPYNLSSLTKVIEYRSIWEIDDYKNKIRPLSMLWTVPRWRKSVVVHYVVFQWLWPALAINLTWFYEINERFRDRGRLDLYTSVSWSWYPSLKSLDTSGGFYGTYFPKGRNLFLCLLKRQSPA